MPLVGPLARGYNAARFTSTLAMLAGAGVPILKALQAAAQTLGNRAMRDDALQALVRMPDDGTYSLARFLATDLGLPGPFLAKILQTLAHAGLLESALHELQRVLEHEPQARQIPLGLVW